MKRGENIPELERKLRRQESTFQQSKKHLLGVGFLELALGGFFAFLLYNFHGKFQGSEGAVLAALFVGVMIVSISVGALMVTVCIRDWHGNATRLLLLKGFVREDDRENTPNKPVDATAIGRQIESKSCAPPPDL